MLTTQVKPISYFKSHAAQIASEMAESGEPLLLNGVKVAFLAGAEADLRDIRRYVVNKFGADAWQVCDVRRHMRTLLARRRLLAEG